MEEIETYLVTTKELVSYLKITKTTIDRWRKKGMPFKQIGRHIRFELPEVMKWIEQYEHQK